MTTIVDFESRSRADLKKVGGRNYWAHPSTEALCAVLYDTDRGDVEVWEQANTPSRHEPCEYVEKLEPWQQEWRCRLHREDAA